MKLTTFKINFKILRNENENIKFHITWTCHIRARQAAIILKLFRCHQTIKQIYILHPILQNSQSSICHQIAKNRFHYFQKHCFQRTFLKSEEGKTMVSILEREMSSANGFRVVQSGNDRCSNNVSLPNGHSSVKP